MGDPTGSGAVLIVDDDPGQRSLLLSCLGAYDLELISAASGEEALALLQDRSVALMVSDVRMPGLSGLETLRRARRLHPELPVLLVTAYADIRDAVAAMRDGAINYLEKPIDVDEFLSCVRATLGLTSSAKPAEPQPALPAGVVAESAAMRRVVREAHVAAPSSSRVLITGESGVGKEVVADLIHQWSPRASGPLVKVNCAAIPETLLESELYGHEKGAFTGAAATRIGRFEEADGGTVFLDEVAEMSPGLQAKLLRVLGNGVFQRVGSNTQRHTDVRVVAATNRNLEEEAVQGRFREDLFYRLAVMEIFVPPLRDRGEDIMPLAHAFAAALSGGRPRLSPATVTALTVYRWPGNVRELRNAVERALLMSRGGVVLPEHLPRRVSACAEDELAKGGVAPQDGQRLADMERVLILQALREKQFNRTETARALGISRRALTYKLRALADEGYTIDAG